MNKMDKERIDYFDIAKGIGIILVVIGHLEYISINLRYSIISFHIPLFFIISGMVFQLTKDEDKDFKVFLSRKSKGLLIPYFWFSLIFLLINAAHIFSGDSTLAILLEYSWQSVCFYGISVLWFLPALFFSSLLFYGLRRNMSHIMTIVTVIILIICAYFLNYGLGLLNAKYSNYFYFYHLQFLLVIVLRSIFTMGFICLGYYFKCLLQKIQINPVIGMIIGILLIVISVICSLTNQAVDLHFMVFNIWYLYLISSVAGSIGVILISMTLSTAADFPLIRLIKYFGKNSLIIMLTHMDLYVLYISIIVCVKLMDYVRILNYIPISCVFVVVLVLILEVYIIEIINRYFTFLLGKSRAKK